MRPGTRGPLARFWRGVAWGVVATVAMSIPMAAGSAAGILPMPRPVPLALVERTFGGLVSGPGLVALAIGSHLAYGGVAGGGLALVASRITIGKGLGWGIFLWLLMGVTWLPFLGWGLFGTSVSPGVAVVTLLLHGIYGAVLGWRLVGEEAGDRPDDAESRVEGSGGATGRHRGSSAHSTNPYGTGS